MIMIRCPNCSRFLTPTSSYSLRGQAISYGCVCGYSKDVFISNKGRRNNGESKGFFESTQFESLQMR